MTDLEQFARLEPLAEGVFRKVYVNPFNTRTVLKEEMQGSRFSNVEEWHVWHDYQHHELGKWLAPCYAISPHGRWLVQARTKPLLKLPDKIPGIFTDLKPENWGEWRGRPVCHDYAHNLTRRYPVSRVKAKWWTP